MEMAQMLIVRSKTIRFLIYIVMFFPLSVAAEIVDNTDAGFSTTGVWSSSTSTPGYYGSNYLVAATGKRLGGSHVELYGRLSRELRDLSALGGV